MKSFAILLSLLCVSTFAFAGEMISHRIYNTDLRIEALPSEFHFKADEIRILDSLWYFSLFGKSCEASLEAHDSETPVELKFVGPNKMEMMLGNAKSSLIDRAYAYYVPTWYNFSERIDAHYLVHLDKWVFLKVELLEPSFFGKRKLKVSLVKKFKDKYGDDRYPVFPIFEAFGR